MGRKSVKFSVGQTDDISLHGDEMENETFVTPEHDVETIWETVWRCKLVFDFGHCVKN